MIKFNVSDLNCVKGWIPGRWNLYVYEENVKQDVNISIEDSLKSHRNLWQKLSRVIQKVNCGLASNLNTFPKSLYSLWDTDLLWEFFAVVQSSASVRMLNAKFHWSRAARLTSCKSTSIYDASTEPADMCFQRSNLWNVWVRCRHNDVKSRVRTFRLIRLEAAGFGRS